MSATGPCATILSERAALALVAAGAADAVVLVEEGDDERGLKEAPDDTEIGPEEVEEVETPGTEVVEVDRRDEPGVEVVRVVIEVRLGRPDET